jgi:TetR/AcrR family tetracycline transcriptional repressor
MHFILSGDKVSIMATTQRPSLTRLAIERAALDLVNRVGLDALTMRLLAQELDVQSPALYWHFRNKHELLEGMAEQIYIAGGMGAPGADEPWEQWLMRRSLAYREALNKYRDGARIAATATDGSDTLMGLFDEEITAMVGYGFSPSLALHTVSVVTHYISGFVLKEQDAAGELDALQLPANISATLRDAFQQGGSPLGFEVFVHGIRMIVAGVRAELLEIET